MMDLAMKFPPVWKLPLILASFIAVLVCASFPGRADVLIPLPGTQIGPPSEVTDTPIHPEVGGVLLPFRTLEPREPADVRRPLEEAANRRLFLPLHGGLGSDAHQVLFEGQEAVRRFTVTLPAEAVVADAEFVLSYLSSVQLLPSASRVSVSLNGSEIVSTQPGAFSAPGVVRVSVPDGLLRPGPNDVLISLHQNHRVLCTIEGVYELWTAIDALRSGLELRLVEALATPSLASFDHALSSGLSGSRRLTFIAPSAHPSEAWLANAFDVVQGAARRTSGPLPEFAVLSQAELERGEPTASSLRGIQRDALPSGMLALIGTSEELRELLPRQILSFVTGPYLGVHGLGRRDGSALLVFSGRDQQELREAVEDWISQRVELPSARNAITDSLPPTVRRSDLPLVRGGSTVSLAELNVPEQEVSGLRDAILVELQLPDDFFAANNAAVHLYLNARYAPDLHPESTLNLLVNGRGAALIGLNRSGGDTFESHPIELPLRYFQPGLNRVELEVNLPSVNATAEGFCPAGTVSLNQPPRFVLHDDTRFAFPAYARLGHLPNLKLLAERGFPYVLNERQMLTDLYLGSRDPATLSAAMTLTAAIARRAEQPLALEPTFSLSHASERDILAVGPTNTLQAGLFGNAPLRQQDLVEAWSRSRPFDPLVSDAQEVAATRATGELLERIDALRSGWGESSSRSGTSRSGAGNDAGEARWYSRLLSFVPSWGKSEQAEQVARRLLQQAGGDVTAVMMQYESSRVAGRTVTLVTAMDGPLLLGALRRVTQPDYWSELRGDLAVWGTQPQTLGTATVGETYTMAPSELSLNNLRLILSNWLSRNVGVLLISVMLVVFALSSVTYLMLRLDRQRRDLA